MKKSKSIKKNDVSLDCVEMKNKIQAKIFKDVKGMSLSQENAYREKKIESGRLAELWGRVKSGSKPSKKAAI